MGAERVLGFGIIKASYGLEQVTQNFWVSVSSFVKLSWLDVITKIRVMNFWNYNIL